MGHPYSRRQRALARGILGLFCLLLAGVTLQGESLLATYGLSDPPAYRTLTFANVLPGLVFAGIPMMLALITDIIVFLLAAGGALWVIGWSASWVWRTATSTPPSNPSSIISA